MTSTLFSSQMLNMIYISILIDDCMADPSADTAAHHTVAGQYRSAAGCHKVEAADNLLVLLLRRGCQIAVSQSLQLFSVISFFVPHKWA